MSYRIGIFGSADGDLKEVLPKAVKLGRILGGYAPGVEIITGACSGLPYIVAQEAAHKGAKVHGFSPMFNIAGQQQFTPDDDLGIYSEIFYVPSDFQFATNDLVCKKYRNVLSTASCDAGIIISGRWGSLNEFTNLIDMQKVVGLLTETGGVADEVLALSQKISKKGQGQLLFNSNPRKLVEDILKVLKTSKRL